MTTIEVDVVDNEVNVNVTSETIELQFFDAAVFDATAFEAWLLALPNYPDESAAFTALGANKLFWINNLTDTEFPYSFKKTRPA